MADTLHSGPGSRQPQNVLYSTLLEPRKSGKRSAFTVTRSLLLYFSDLGAKKLVEDRGSWIPFAVLRLRQRFTRVCPAAGQFTGNHPRNLSE